MDPYEILGVDKSATVDQIKRAYRKKAKQHHPDAGGTEKDFQSLAKANLILSDPTRRSKYDRTGEIDESIDNSLSAAINIIVGFFQAVIQQFATNSQAPDPCSVDLVEQARINFRNQIKSFNEQKRPFEKGIETIKKVEARLKARKKSNALVNRGLLHHIDDLKQRVAGIDRQILQYEDALKMLDDYTFDPEQPANFHHITMDWKSIYDSSKF